ncbi:MAG TPA: CDP-alcohol phosphatidyltransferase family protein [Verrucomicrobiales bacterium]|nr:CDP-alcohol phosphatidyltransferase family protein [Verrucomicrobiales bacterium]
MTTANKISIGRLLLIPVFVGFALYYARSVAMGSPREVWRWAAVATFLVAALSDAVDGYIARRWSQQTRLGLILDPLADKGLMLAAIVTLSVSSWPDGFPLWFVLIVVSRDFIIIGGALALHYWIGKVRLHPHMVGKAATFFQIVSIAWVMLRVPWPSLWATVPAGILTFFSGVIYIADGIGQVHASSHGRVEAE